MDKFEGEQFAIAKGYVNKEAILTFLVANGFVIDCESDANFALATFFSALSDSYEAAEIIREKKEAAERAALAKKVLEAKRVDIAVLTGRKTAAVRQLESGIKEIVASIPEEERTEGEQALLGAPLKRKRVV